MCAPIALTGLQIAGAIASSAAQQSELKRQARQAEMQAKSEAAFQAARAEFSRDDAERGSAADRVAQFSQPSDPKSESALATLAARHSRRLDEVRGAEHQGALALYRGRELSRSIKRSSRSALSQSLLSLAGMALSRQNAGATIRIPF